MGGVGKVDILLNNTVLSNFGLINRMELLRRAVEGRAGTTEEVVREVDVKARRIVVRLLEGLEWS